MKDEKIVMYESDEAAQIKAVTGWVSRTGHFYGENESTARYDGCTHRLCDCGHVISKSRIQCDCCYSKIARERYLALPFREYDGSPVYHADSEEYFFDEGSMIDFMEDHELEEIDLYFCVTQAWTRVDSDVWESIMPEDEYDLPNELQAALDNLNAVIEKLPPCSYYPGKERTTYKKS